MLESIHIHPHVQLVRNLHKDIILSVNESTGVVSYLNRISENLFEAFLNKDVAAHVEFRNYHYFFVGKDAETILNANITINDAHRVIAKEYGFDNWDQVLDHGNVRFNMNFENLIDSILEGRIENVIELLAMKPDLINQRSPFYHRGSLLHYCTANGVEIHRQIVPNNLIEIVNILITKDADKMALGNFYDTRLPAHLLVDSSAHIRDSGFRDELLKLLQPDMTNEDQLTID